MVRSKTNFLLVVVLAALSLVGLITIQFQVLSSDVVLKQDQIEYAIPAILADVHDRWMHNKTLRGMIGEVEGTAEFSISSEDRLEDPLKRQLALEIDRTLSHNSPELEYELNVFISSDYGCLIHEYHNAHLPRTNKIIPSKNHMCMCSIGLNKTFDVSFRATNTEGLAYSSAKVMIGLTLLLAGIVSAAFFYMIFTINRQKKLSELKNDFVNNLTHEFKTPIFSITLAANALKEEEIRQDPARLEKYVGLIEHEGKRLRNQVDKILQMALIESGNMTIEKKELDIHQLIEREADSFRLMVEERGGRIELRLKAKHALLTGDETHLRNIIYNLLDNAQKYCDGSPVISIETSDVDSGLAISISDNGVGMPAEVQKFVFDKFYRAPTGDIHNVKGFGLGLSYVKNIVEAHRGWIKLDSTLKKGSEFTIYFPAS